MENKLGIRIILEIIYVLLAFFILFSLVIKIHTVFFYVGLSLTVLYSFAMIMDILTEIKARKNLKKVYQI